MQQPSFSIYDASAGSGKTYTLVREYLRIILTAQRDDAYRNILAITFTNKAVHEMKSRIVGSLSEFAKDDPNDKAVDLMESLSVLTGLSLNRIKEKSQQIIRHIIHNYAAFDISTIDKFTHRVIRAFSHDLNLPVTFEVSLDTENLLAEAVDAIIARAGEDDILTKLLIDFTMEKTDDDKSWDISREIFNTGRLILNENNRDEIANLQQTTITDFIALKQKLSDACAALESENAGLAQAALGVLEHHGVELKSFSGSYFPKHLEGICRGVFNPANKTYREPEDIKVNKGAKDINIIESLVPQLLDITNRIYKNYGRRDFYKAFLRNITPLSLLNTVGQELKQIQAEQNVLSISEFNAIIHNEIQNQPAPFIYERLGERYRHFFIDEFQDTSEMQWQNLVPLINNALAGQDDYGQKGTLLIVGDPKQSIYRWRGGKAEQFIGLSKGENPFSNPDKQLFSLDTNRRSYAEVVRFNNELFAMLSEEFAHADYNDLYLNRSRQLPNDKKGGYVDIRFLDEATENEEGESPDRNSQFTAAIEATIAQALERGFLHREIVILTRKRDQGVAVAKYLTERNIPIVSSETLLLIHAMEVRFMVALLRYLDNNADAEAKAFFLYYIAKELQSALPLHDFIATGISHRDEVHFESWLQAMGVKLPFGDIRRKSLYEAVEMIVAACIRPEKNNAYVQHFLDIVLEREFRSQGGLSDFLDFWEKSGSKFSIASPEGRDAIRIMTIHKSKGLEFPVVIFPFAEEDFSRKPKDKLWLDIEDDTMGIPKVLIDNNKAVEGFGEGAAVIYQQKKQEELLDNINVLYVALTRAEEQLYIISGMNLNKNGTVKENNLSAFFIKYLQKENLFDTGRFHYHFGNPEKVSPKPKETDKPIAITPVIEAMDMSAIKIAQREAIMWGSRQQEAIEYGNLVHEVMSFVHTAADVDLAVTKALESGIVNLLQSGAIREMAQRIVTEPELLPFYAPGNTILNEQAIIRQSSGILKPDRMALGSDGGVLLLDYKTGAHLPKHNQQLEAYAAAIEEMGYHVTKKALVYIGETLEIVHL